MRSFYVTTVHFFYAGYASGSIWKVNSRKRCNIDFVEGIAPSACLKNPKDDISSSTAAAVVAAVVETPAVIVDATSRGSIK